MFSIIITSYNYDKYIKETIESVLAQTYSDWELLIVDDGSVDNSLEIIKKYCNDDNRIKLYTHENIQNKGIIETLKLGIQNAKSDWMVFLESDDTITPDYLEKKLEIIGKYPDIKFIFNDINMFGEKDRIEYMQRYYNHVHRILDNTVFPANLKFAFKKANIVPSFSTVAIKKDLLAGLNFDDCKLAKCLDMYLWTQAAKENKFYYINEKLTNWRLHSNSYIQKKETDIQTERYFYKIQVKENLSDNKIINVLRRIYFYTIYTPFSKITVFLKKRFKNIWEGI